MANIQIITTRSAPLHTCGNEQICLVELAGTAFEVDAEKNDTLEFIRQGPDNTNGFMVEIMPRLGPQDVYDAPAGQSSLTIPVPSGQTDGVYKYEVTYDKEPADIHCIPLDPVIIIQPSSIQPLLRHLVTFLSVLVGLAAGAGLAHWLK